ncbi:MAG: hypothetical protein GEV28_33720 [Actinophytocola sp.]|nr:hypothetical protein [Actinophytocola sp.]
MDQVVVLGAGMDTPRLPASRPVRRAGVRSGPTSEHRHQRTRVRVVLGDLPDCVRLVPVDFETDDVRAGVSHQVLDR